MNDVSLSEVLSKLADHIERAPANLTGVSVSVFAGAGGPVTGLSVTATGGGPGTRTTGLSVTVDHGRYKADANSLVADLREAAEAAKSAKPPKSWLTGLLSRAGALGNDALKVAIATATAEIMKHYV